MPVSRKRSRRGSCSTCKGRKFVMVGQDHQRRPIRATCPDCTLSTGRKRNPIK